MTQAFETRPADEPATPANVLEATPAWTPVLLTGSADNDVKTSDNRVKSALAPGRGLSQRRLGGLDGLRAIAVMAVVVFHLDFSLAPGGFLGVDVFFVISGFLITNLIATEILETGRLRLGAFYLRRARRLLPTVLVLLAVVSAGAVTFWRDQLATLRGGVLSSLGYVTNWWLIADHQSYFVATGRPTMLQHLWSLAIEEQFYIVWSVAVMAVAGVLLRSRRCADPVQRVRCVVGVAAALALGSTAIMAVLAEQQDLPYNGSTSRVYFGSDTHTMGLFLGAAAGAWIALRHAGSRQEQTFRPSATARPRYLTDPIGAAAVVVIGYEFFHVDEFSPQLYRGGFLLLDIAVLVAVLCASRRASLLGRVLDMRPTRWLGQRSYSIYIWHWPVCVITRPGLDVHGPSWLLNGLRVVLILALSTLSYRFVELPLRTGQFRYWRSVQKTPTSRRNEIVALVCAVVAGGALLLSAHPVGAVGVSPNRPARLPASLPAAIARQPDPATPAAGTTSSATSSAPRPAIATWPPSVSGYGDSVLLGAGDALQARTKRLTLDAVEGRQASDVLNDVAADARAGRLRPDVVIHIGDNGIISPPQLDATLRALADRARVLIMTVRVPRDWQDPNNATIRAAAKKFNNVRVVDWHAIAGAHPNWLYSDGLHLTKAGAAGYAHMVLTALHKH